MSRRSSITTGGAPAGTIFVSAVTVDATLAANLPAGPSNGQTHLISVGGSFQNSALIQPQNFVFEADDYIRYDGNLLKWTAVIGNADIDDTAFGVGWDSDTLNAPSRNAVYDQLVIEHTAAGFNAAGELSAMVQGNYLSAAASLRAGELVLDGHIFSALSYASAIQAELDTTQSNIGLLSTGVLSGFSAYGMLSTATSLVQAHTLTHGVLSSIEGSAGLPATGVLSPFSGTNYIDGLDMRAALVQLDSKIKSESIKYAIALGG